MLVRATLVEAEQHGPIRIQDLTKVMARRRLGLAEERLVPFEAARNVAYADDRPGAFHRSSAVGLTRRSSAPKAFGADKLWKYLIMKRKEPSRSANFGRTGRGELGVLGRYTRESFRSCSG